MASIVEKTGDDTDTGELILKSRRLPTGDPWTLSQKKPHSLLLAVQKGSLTMVGILALNCIAGVTGRPPKGVSESGTIIPGTLGCCTGVIWAL